MVKGEAQIRVRASDAQDVIDLLEDHLTVVENPVLERRWAGIVRRFKGAIERDLVPDAYSRITNRWGRPDVVNTQPDSTDPVPPDDKWVAVIHTNGRRYEATGPKRKIALTRLLLLLEAESLKGA